MWQGPTFASASQSISALVATVKVTFTISFRPSLLAPSLPLSLSPSLPLSPSPSPSLLFDLSKTYGKTGLAFTPATCPAPLVPANNCAGWEIQLSDKYEKERRREGGREGGRGRKERERREVRRVIWNGERGEANVINRNWYPATAAPSGGNTVSVTLTLPAASDTVLGVRYPFFLSYLPSPPLLLSFSPSLPLSPFYFDLRRYAYSIWPLITIYCIEGLPAVPFQYTF